jgi:hypothetical protein
MACGPPGELILISTVFPVGRVRQGSRVSGHERIKRHEGV